MIPSIQTALTMTSREIAVITEKEHTNIKRDIAAMILQLNNPHLMLKDCPDFHPSDLKGHGITLTTFEHCGNIYDEFILNQEYCLLLVSGYNVTLRQKIIKRWQELESKSEKNQILVPDFSNPAEAARAWAAQYEAAQLAIATKAEIGSRREATAMNTASQAVKQVNKLEIELDRSKQFSSVKRMEMLYHGQKFNWRELKSTCALMGLEPIDIFDANYGTVKAWPAEVWREVYALEIF
jgi:phage regulator Rha-like protein